jgi:hypothetical protein
MQHSGDTGLATAKAGATTFVRSRAGRIVEVHVGLLASRADVEGLTEAVWAALRRAGSGAMICADYRGAAPVTGEIASLWSTAMRKTNGSIARSAVLLDASNTLFNLQVARMVRCAANERRRLFEDEQELRRWLDDGLTDSERDALRTLFSGVQQKEETPLGPRRSPATS